MAWYDAIPIVGDVVSGIAGIVDANKQSKIDKQNFQLQQDMFNYQKQLQQTVFDREDNAVQRRVADLKAAGLNPALAAGSAAGAGSVVTTSTPQQNYTPKQQKFQRMFQGLMQSAQMKQIQQQMDYNEAQTGMLDKQQEFIDKKIEEIDQALTYAKDNNLPPGAVASMRSQAAEVTNDAVAGIGDLIDSVTTGAGNMISAVTSNGEGGYPTVREQHDAAVRLLESNPVTRPIADYIKKKDDRAGMERALEQIRTPAWKVRENQRYVDSLRRRARGW